MQQRINTTFSFESLRDQQLAHLQICCHKASQENLLHVQLGPLQFARSRGMARDPNMQGVMNIVQILLVRIHFGSYSTSYDDMNNNQFCSRLGGSDFGVVLKCQFSDWGKGGKEHTCRQMWKRKVRGRRRNTTMHAGLGGRRYFVLILSNTFAAASIEV